MKNSRWTSCRFVILMSGIFVAMAFDNVAYGGLVRFYANTCPVVNCGPIKFSAYVYEGGNLTEVICQDEMMEYSNSNDSEKWIGKTSIPYDKIENTKVIFTTAFGEQIEVSGEEATEYTYSLTDSRLGIVYSYLKGTYMLGNSDGTDSNNSIQINAELFDDDNKTGINASYSEVEYHFYVYDVNGEPVAESTDANKPYFEWTPTEAQWYNIRVEARLGGELFTACDRFPVLNAPIAEDIKAASGHRYKIYFDAGTWRFPHAYIHGKTSDGSTYNITFPPLGNELSKHESGYYCYSFYTSIDPETIKIRFNNNTTNAGYYTEDFALYDNGIYNKNGYRNRTFFAAEAVPSEPSGTFSMPEITVNETPGDYYENGRKLYRYYASLTASAHTDTDSEYNWVKFEDWESTDITGQHSSYSDVALDFDGNPTGKIKDDWSDNKDIAFNHSPIHYCRNWHPAYYRVYMTCQDNLKGETTDEQYLSIKAAASGTSKAATAGIITNANAAKRIAKTIAAPSMAYHNGTTGVENLTDVQSADLIGQSEYYDLQGRKLITAPTAPGLYIRRQGDSAIKILIK